MSLACFGSRRLMNDNTPLHYWEAGRHLLISREQSRDVRDPNLCFHLFPTRSKLPQHKILTLLYHFCLFWTLS